MLIIKIKTMLNVVRYKDILRVDYECIHLKLQEEFTIILLVDLREIALKKTPRFLAAYNG